MATLSYTGRVKRVWVFLPFLLVSGTHLVALFIGADDLATPTKWFLMPALALGFLAALPRRRTELALVGLVAIALSWAGDVLLGMPGDVGFLVGLGLFFLAHAAYVIQFRRSLRERRMPRTAVIFVAWWIALLAVLLPHLGALTVPVAAYGVVLGLSAATALASNRAVAVGAGVFLASDTVLAFKMFWPDFALWQVDFIIMTGYVSAQGLIAWGSVTRAQAIAREQSAGGLPADAVSS